VAAVDIVFFDIGGTLGTATQNGLAPFPSSARLLKQLRDVVGLRIGIITTLGDAFTNAQAMTMLQQAGLAQFVDPQGFVSDHDTNGVAKPKPAIYQFAAQKAGVPIDRCLFVGENFAEVIGARAAGMQILLKPSPPGAELL
jgi:FMN phosphatase YigB (HAD superfamily)